MAAGWSDASAGRAAWPGPRGSTGLHPHDIQRMNDLLLRLRDKGNTVLVVEHEPETIAIADLVAARSTLTGEHLAAYVGTLPGGRLVEGAGRRVETLQVPTADGDGELLVGVDLVDACGARRPARGAALHLNPGSAHRVRLESSETRCHYPATSGHPAADGIVVRRGSRRSGTSAARARSDGS